MTIDVTEILQQVNEALTKEDSGALESVFSRIHNDFSKEGSVESFNGKKVIIELLPIFAQKFSKTNIELAVSALHLGFTNGDDEVKEACGNITREIAKTAPEHAMNAAHELSYYSAHHETYQSILGEISKVDPKIMVDRMRCYVSNNHGTYGLVEQMASIAEKVYK